MSVSPILFPFPVEWSAGFKVEREYRTTIQVSRSGKEQRRALRNRPRKKLMFSVRQSGWSDSAWHAFAKAYVGQDFYVADESRTVSVAAAIASTDTTFAIAAAQAWIGNNIVLISPIGTRQMVTVGTVAGTTVTITAATGQAWPVGTIIQPALLGRFADSIEMTADSNGVSTASLTFVVQPLSEVEMTPAAASVTYNGREVCLLKPNWATSPKVTFAQPFDTIDYGFGAIAYYNPIAYVSRAQQGTYVAFSADQAAGVEDIFNRARGQLGEFYMPTWKQDFLPTGDAAIGATSFTAQGTDLATYFSHDTVFAAIIITYKDGSYQFATVSSLSVAGNNTLVVLASALTNPIDSTVASISWMPVHRFATDLLTTEWITNTIAEFQLSVVSLEDLTAGG